MSLLLTIATPLITKVAGNFLSRITGGANVAKETASNSLLRLINNGLLKGLPEDGEVTDDVISKISGAIREFQKKAKLAVTGVLDDDTAKWIFESCDGMLQSKKRSAKQDMPVPPADGTTNKLRYWIEPGSLPTLTDGGDPVKLLREAFVSWAKYIEIDILEVDTQDECNVLIHSGPMDGPGGALADATVGPPDIKQNDLKFDSTESSWDTVKFRYTCVHEIGHILGLEHTPESGQIMSSVRQRDITNPTDADVKQLERDWTLRDFPEQVLDAHKRLLESGSTEVIKM